MVMLYWEADIVDIGMFFLEPCFQIFISLHFASEMALEPSINDMHLSAA